MARIRQGIVGPLPWYFCAGLRCSVLDDFSFYGPSILVSMILSGVVATKKFYEMGQGSTCISHVWSGRGIVPLV